MRRHHFVRSTFVPALLMLGSIVAFPHVQAQETREAPKTKATAFDKQDFTGTWDLYRVPRGGTPDPNLPAPAEIPPPPLKPEYKAEWEAKRKTIADAEARGEPIANEYTHCMPDGMPTMMRGMFPMEVLQTRNQVTIIQEAYNQVRRIYLNDKLPAIEDAEPGFWGHSVGRWEGDTLVVDTVGVKDYVLFLNVPHSASMRIHERIRILTPKNFEDVVTITDPEYLEKPWTWRWVYQRRPNYKMNEYVCEENHEFADPETGAQRMRIVPPK